MLNEQAPTPFLVSSPPPKKTCAICYLMDFNSIEFYTILLVVAFALLGVFFSPKDKPPVHSHIVAMTLTPLLESAVSECIKLTALEGGLVLLQHNCVPLHEGESVNIVASVAGDVLKLVEKKGVVTSDGDVLCQAVAAFSFLKPHTYSVRFESEVTGQWCTFSFAATAGNNKVVNLKL